MITNHTIATRAMLFINIQVYNLQHIDINS